MTQSPPMMQNPVSLQGASAPLGKVAKAVGRTPRRSSVRHDRFRKLGHAQKLLIKHNVGNTKDGIHRTRTCHAHRAYGQQIKMSLSTDPNHSTATIGGVQTCGSVWTCPVCAQRVAVQRAKEVTKAIQWAEQNKYIPLMITVTARHHKNTRLNEFKERFKLAWRRFSQNRAWRNIKEQFRFSYAIRATEITHGEENGWHYHYHVLIFAESHQADDSAWIQKARESWLSSLAGVGLDGVGEYAFHVAIDYRKEDYIAKMGLSEEPNTAKTEHEMTGNANKNNRPDDKSVNQWGLLGRSSRGDIQSELLFIEFAEAMQGEYWLFWSAGFKALVGVDDLSDVQLSEDEPELPEMDNAWLVISDEDYAHVRRHRAYADVIQVAEESRSQMAVMRFIRELAIVQTNDAINERLQMIRNEVADLRRKVNKLEQEAHRTKNGRLWHNRNLALSALRYREHELKRITERYETMVKE